MEDSKLAQYMQRQLGKGACVGRAKGSTGPFSAWHRDLGQCWHLIVSEAISATQAAFELKHADDEEALKESMEVLDTIAKMVMSIYADSLKDNLGGITKFGELYSYLEHEGGNEEYATFAGFVVQAMFLYMFTSMEMAIGLPQDICDDVYEYGNVMSVLSVLDEDTRKAAMQQFMQQGLLPTAINYSKLLRRIDPFMDVIKEDQKRAYANMKAKEERDSGRTEEGSGQ